MVAKTFPNILPTRESPGINTTYSLSSASFGDGYEQNVIKGINNIKRSWELSWSNYEKGEIKIIKDFFDSLGGAIPFRWQAPQDTESRLWLCKEGYSEKIEGNSNTLTTTISLYDGPEP